MRDGIHLTIDYYALDENQKLPVIVELTPYGRGPESVNYRYEAAFWYSHGYRLVIGDCRGTGDSEGDMIFLAKEGEDGYDLIEWIARQPWSNGRIGMRGSSYTGSNQWYIAKEQPPHLSCITPSATVGRQMEDIPYLNGAFGVGWAINWIGRDLNANWSKPTTPPNLNSTSWLKHRPLKTLDVFALGRELPIYRTFLDHPVYDDYWRVMDFTQDDFAKIKIPALAFTGWYDGTMYGTIWRFQQARLYSSSRDDQFLIIGPYTHGNAPDGGYNFATGQPMLTVGDLPVSLNAILPGLNMTRTFFDWCLKDGTRPDWQPVRIFITGSEKWMTLDRFPPSSIREQSLFLAKDGHLTWSNSAEGQSDFYIYDPLNPLLVQYYPKPLALPVDINPLLDRNDLLVYTSENLTKPLTVVGDVIVELKISSSVTDTDFIVQLMDVFPDGRSIRLGSKTASQIRTRYREGYIREVLMQPNETYLVRIEVHEIGHTFLPNHKIRLAITSSFYPWVSANPNTGRSIATDIEMPIIANQTIHYDSYQPSRINFLVLDKPTFDPST